MPRIITAGQPAQPATTTQPQSARDRAIARFLGGEQKSDNTPTQPTETKPVSQDSPINPNKVTAEDMSALRQTPTNEAPAAESKQSESDDKTDASQSKAAKTSEEEKKDESASKEEPSQPSSLSLLARKEKALRLKSMELKAREDALKQREESLSTKEPEQKTTASNQSDVDLRARLKQNPRLVFSELGLTYDDITKAVLNDSNDSQQPSSVENEKLTALEAEIKAIKDAQNAAKDEAAKLQKQAYDNAVNKIRTDVRELVKSQPDAYEMINLEGAAEDVVELIETTFAEGLDDEYPKGTVLPTNVAAKMIEDELLERARKWTKAKKLASTLSSKETKIDGDSKENTTTKPNESKVSTLTHSGGAPAPTKMSARDRAIAAMQGRLQK